MYTGLRFIRWNKRVHPTTLDQQAITAYLEYLVIHRQVSLATRRTALNALLTFIYSFQAGMMTGLNQAHLNAHLAKKLPVVLSNQALRISAIRQSLETKNAPSGAFLVFRTESGFLHKLGQNHDAGAVDTAFDMFSVILYQ